MNLGEDVPPTILPEQMMQPKYRQAEEGDSEQRRPWRDPASCDGGFQAHYRIRASAVVLHTGPVHRTVETARVGVPVFPKRSH